jgi:hypothetical protein
VMMACMSGSGIATWPLQLEHGLSGKPASGYERPGLSLHEVQLRVWTAGDSFANNVLVIGSSSFVRDCIPVYRVRDTAHGATMRPRELGLGSERGQVCFHLRVKVFINAVELLPESRRARRDGEPSLTNDSLSRFERFEKRESIYGVTLAKQVADPTRAIYSVSESLGLASSNAKIRCLDSLHWSFSFVSGRIPMVKRLAVHVIRVSIDSLNDSINLQFGIAMLPSQVSSETAKR